MEAEESKTEALKRRKRVNIYKKIIISVVIFLLIIPIILCIVLFIKVNNLQEMVNKLASQQENTYVSAESSKEELQDIDEQATIARKKAYLTFDDGPSENTEKIINILDQYHVKATFFVMGKTDEQSLQRYKNIVSSGNAIGLHSYSHDYKKVYSSIESFGNEFSQIRELIDQTTGVDTTIIRLPGGSSTTRTGSIPMEDFIRFTKQQGYTYFDWNVSSGDGSNTVIDSQQIINNIILNVDNVEEPIILMHDTGYKTTTVEALPVIIEQLLQKGYELCPIDETVTPIQHIKAENIN